MFIDNLAQVSRRSPAWLFPSQKFETCRQVAFAWQEGKHQKSHAQ